MKIVTKIALGVVVLFLIMAALGSSSDNKPPQAQTSTTPTNSVASDPIQEAEPVVTEEATSDQKTEVEPVATPEVTPTVYKVGDRVVVGDMAYTVNKIEKKGFVGDKYSNAKANGIYVIADMTIENLGKESISISSNYVKIVDSQGRTFESDSSAWVYIKDNIVFKQIQPGLPVKGQAIFDVPKGITCDLQVADSSWSPETQLISLGTI